MRSPPGKWSSQAIHCSSARQVGAANATTSPGHLGSKYSSKSRLIRVGISAQIAVFFLQRSLLAMCPRRKGLPEKTFRFMGRRAQCAGNRPRLSAIRAVSINPDGGCSPLGSIPHAATVRSATDHWNRDPREVGRWRCVRFMVKAL